MFKDFRVGQYFNGQSIVHELDPRTKLWGYIVLSTLVFANGQRWSMLCTALALFWLMWITQIPWRYYLSSIKSMWLILLITIVFNSVRLHSSSGLAVHFGALSLNTSGMLFGLVVGVKIVFVVLLTSVFTFTTSPIALSDGLEIIFGPLTQFGFPAHEIALMMSITIRFIPTIMAEGDRLVKALQARGADIGGGGLYKRARNLAPLLIPLFIGAFRRADELALAMEIRCYRGNTGRTRYRQLRLGRADYVSIGALTIILLLELGFKLA
ncbi:MAG: energy-coupling factor transporter transmembrane component T [Peptococcaceae bacterium]|nr:energy-coupling factor transporter transmembrane component T [Peptococcaceae bacterium]